MKKHVLKAMVRLKWNWILALVLIVLQIIDWGGYAGTSSFLAFVIVCLIYEITAKNERLKAIHRGEEG